MQSNNGPNSTICLHENQDALPYSGPQSIQFIRPDRKAYQLASYQQAASHRGKRWSQCLKRRPNLCLQRVGF